MTFLDLFDETTSLRVTRTLLHLLWEGFAIGLATSALARAFRSATAQVRYGIHAAGLAMIALCVPLTLAWISSGGFSSSPELGGARVSRASPSEPSIGPEPSSPGTAPWEAAAGGDIAAPPAGAFVAENAPTVPTGWESWLSTLLRSASPFAAAAYIFGVAAMWGRLCCALWGVRRLRRRAVPVQDLELLSQIRRQAGRIGLKVVPVVAWCDRIAIPVAVGILQPMILLPAWLTARLEPEQLQVILAHEMAHIRRLDLLVSLLQRLLETLLFFHPVVWHLSRQLSAERENCCDDAVLQAGHERLAYAGTLVRMAQLCAAIGRPVPAADLATLAANGGSDTQLKRRVLRLIGDERRPNRTRADSLTLVLSAGLVTAAVMGFWSRSQASVVDEPVVNAAVDEPVLKPAIEEPVVKPAAEEPPAGAKPAADARPTRPIRGRVLDAARSPVAGVTVQVPPALLAPPGRRGPPRAEERRAALQATTDAEGRFALDVEEGRQFLLLAMRTGFAVEPIDIPPQGDVTALEVVLRPEQPIRGRIVDSEGKPVAGARVAIARRMAIARPDALNRYLEVRKQNAPGQPPETLFMMPGFMPMTYATNSDADGRFLVHGIANDDACELIVTAERFTEERLIVVNRQGLDPRPFNPPSPPRLGMSQRLVGPDFTHVATPGLMIEGRVTLEGQPAAGVMIRARANFTVLGMAITDAEGRYRFPGLPRGRELTLMFGDGPDRAGDFPSRNVTVSTTQSDSQKTIDVELRRPSQKPGIVLSGRVLDPATGKGVPAFVSFSVLPGNELAGRPDYEDLRDSERMVRADATGEFRITVVPGPCVLLLQANPAAGQSFSPFLHAAVSKADREKLKITDSPGLREGIPTARGGITPLSLYVAARYIDYAEGSQAEPLEITLDRGKTLDVEIVDPEGQPVSGATIAGIDDTPRLAEHSRESRLTIYALHANAPRKIMALLGARGLAGSLTLTGEEASPVRWTLGKAASIRGRAVDRSGAPFAQAPCLIHMPAARNRLQVENRGLPELTLTDSEGRFRILNLIPGERFDFRLRVDGTPLTASLTAEQQTLKPGQDLDLGDVTFAP